MLSHFFNSLVATLPLAVRNSGGVAVFVRILWVATLLTMSIVLGLPAGIFATILGLLLVLAYSVFLKICKKTQVIAVPLVPFLSAGCAAGYLIG